LLAVALVVAGGCSGGGNKATELNPHGDLPALPGDPHSTSVARGAQGGGASTKALRPSGSRDPAREPRTLVPQAPLPDVLGEGGAGGEE